MRPADCGREMHPMVLRPTNIVGPRQRQSRENSESARQQKTSSHSSILYSHNKIILSDKNAVAELRESSLESAAKRNCLDTSGQSGKSIYTIHSQNMLKFFSSPLDPDEFMTK